MKVNIFDASHIFRLYDKILFSIISHLFIDRLAYIFVLRDVHNNNNNNNNNCKKSPGIFSTFVSAGGFQDGAGYTASCNHFFYCR